MAVLTRLLPRDWDGRRLLRFLTGLALLALAFTAPVAAAPAPVSQVAQAPAALSQPEQGPAAQSTTADSTVTETRTAQTGAAQASGNGTADQAASASARSAMRSQECMHDGSGIPRGVRPASETAALAGVTPGAQGSRGPPTA